MLPKQGKDLTAQQQSLVRVPAEAKQVASVKDATTTAKSFTSTDEVAAAIKADAEKRAAKAAAQEKAEAAAAKERAAKAAANRSKQRAAKPSYPDNLDGWIREARAIMAKHRIPGSYDGIKRNIIRESGGDPNAVNNWDINAQNGIPSKGLLQVIQPTFDQYHVNGTSGQVPTRSRTSSPPATTRPTATARWTTSTPPTEWCDHERDAVHT